MQVWLLSCHSVSPPWVWTLFVRAPSGLHVLCVFLVLPCLHVCVLFTFVLVHAYASSTTRNQMTTCAYTEPRHARSTTAEQPTGQLNGPPRDKARGSPRDNRGMTRGTATGHPQWPPQEKVSGPAAVRLKSRVLPTAGSAEESCDSMSHRVLCYRTHERHARGRDEPYPAGRWPRYPPRPQLRALAHAPRGRRPSPPPRRRANLARLAQFNTGSSRFWMLLGGTPDVITRMLLA